MGTQAVGLVGAGKQATAVGGFVLDTTGNGINNAVVRLYNTNTGLGTCAAPGPALAQYQTLADGFYFISRMGSNQTSVDPNPNPLASGIRYYETVCVSPGSTMFGRFIDHKLANKEFDEEDFYLTP